MAAAAAAAGGGAPRAGCRDRGPGSSRPCSNARPRRPAERVRPTRRPSRRHPSTPSRRSTRPSPSTGGARATAHAPRVGGVRRERLAGVLDEISHSGSHSPVAQDPASRRPLHFVRSLRVPDDPREPWKPRADPDRGPEVLDAQVAVGGGGGVGGWGGGGGGLEERKGLRCPGGGGGCWWGGLWGVGGLWGSVGGGVRVGPPGGGGGGGRGGEGCPPVGARMTGVEGEIQDVVGWEATAAGCGEVVVSYSPPQCHMKPWLELH